MSVKAGSTLGSGCVYVCTGWIFGIGMWMGCGLGKGSAWALGGGGETTLGGDATDFGFLLFCLLVSFVVVFS